MVREVFESLGDAGANQQECELRARGGWYSHQRFIWWLVVAVKTLKHIFNFRIKTSTFERIKT